MVYFLILTVMIPAFAIASKFILKLVNINDDSIFFIGQIIAGVFWVVAMCLLNMHLRSIDFIKSIRFLGFGPVNFKQILVGILSLIPIWLCYGIPALVLHQQIVLRPHWLLEPLWIIITPGLVEQTLAQGFIYRNLREGRSFMVAATYSAILWGLSHGYIFFSGFTNENISFFIQAMIGAILFAYPAVFLFERGNNVIWGFALCHIGIDSPTHVFDFVGGAEKSGIWSYSNLIGVIVCVCSIFLLGCWLIPKPRKVEN